LPRPILIDKGAGGEEADRAESAAEKMGYQGITTWDGSFASFAAHIQRSRLYIGYDSAGGHVAAACGVPLISIFAGSASERMFQRWRPSGPGPITVIPAGPSVPYHDTLAQASAALTRFAVASGERDTFRN
jgi:ADP-heptose:LPS heptosyltransferase